MDAPIPRFDPDALVDPHWHRTLRRTVHATIGSTSEPKPVEQ